MTTTAIVLSTVFTLLLLERVIFLQLLKKFLPQLSKTTSFLRASNMLVSTLHAGASFAHGAWILYLTEYTGQKTLQDLEPAFATHMFMELGYYLYDTVSEVIQLAMGEKEDAATAAEKKRKNQEGKEIEMKNQAESLDALDVQTNANRKIVSKVTKNTSASAAPKKKGSACSAILQAGFLLHHLPPLAGLVSYYFYSQQQTAIAKRVTTVVILRVFLWHATTPMQNLRWFLDHLKVDPRNSNLYKVNYGTFMALFFAIRIYGCLPLLRSVIWLYDLPQSTTTWQIITEVMPGHCVLWTGILYVLSCYWWFLNAKRARKVFGGDSKRVVTQSVSAAAATFSAKEKALLRTD